MLVGGFELLVIATVLPDNRKEMLLNGEVDCLVACYSKTDTRLENFDFSPIYYTDESTEYDHATVIKHTSYEDLSIALEEGRVDAAVMDGAFVDTYINDDRSLLEDFSASDQDYAVATQKGSNLSQPVVDTIQAMLDDGTIATLIDKWD